MQWIDIIGYAGSALVAISLMMNNIWRLRWINLVGASIFATYGFLINAWPVVGLNSFIAVVDVVYLVILSQKRDAFSFFAVAADAPFLTRFLDFWTEDITRFFPDFRFDGLKRPHIRLILRNMLPVGLFVCEDEGEGTAGVRLDYVVPGYRDRRNARFVYSSSHEILKAAGFHTFAARTEIPAHGRYLERVGFRPDPEIRGRYTRPV